MPALKVDVASARTAEESPVTPDRKAARQGLRIDVEAPALKAGSPRSPRMDAIMAAVAPLTPLELADGRWTPLKLDLWGSWRCMRLAAYIAAASVPMLLAYVWLLDAALEDWRDDGVDVRLPPPSMTADDRDRPWAFKLAGVLAGVGAAVATTVSVASCAFAMGMPVPGRRFLLATTLAMGVGTLSAPLAETVLLEPAGVPFVALLWSSVLGRRAGAIVFAMVLTSTLMLLAIPLVLFPIFNESSEGTKVAIVVAYPLLWEACLVPARLMVRLSRGPEVSNWGLVWVAVPHAASALFGRMLIVSFDTVWGQGAGVMGMGAVSVLLRLVQRRLDNFFGCARGDCSALSFTIKAHDVLMASLADMWGTFVILAVQLLWRFDTAKAAPAAGPIFASAAFQLAVELVVDAAPGLLGGYHRIARRSVERRVRALKAWDRRFVAVLGVNFVALGMCELFLLVGPIFGVLCPWAKHEGWWSYAPCSKTSSWVG